jgi:hypothetical protein
LLRLLLVRLGEVPTDAGQEARLRPPRLGSGTKRGLRSCNAFVCCLAGCEPTTPVRRKFGRRNSLIHQQLGAARSGCFCTVLLPRRRDRRRLSPRLG